MRWLNAWSDVQSGAGSGQQDFRDCAKRDQDQKLTAQLLSHEDADQAEDGDVYAQFRKWNHLARESQDVVQVVDELWKESTTKG